MLVADLVKIPPFTSLAVVLAILASSIGASLLWPRQHELHRPA
jgi:hypothetical protein